jgi:hypothetical protein
MTVTLPPTLIGLTSGAIIPGAPASEQKTNTSFSGTFVIYRVLHIGDFRNPDGVGWSSNFECLAQPGSGASGSDNPTSTSNAVQDSSAAQNPNNDPVQSQ